MQIGDSLRGQIRVIGSPATVQESVVEDKSQQPAFSMEQAQFTASLLKHLNLLYSQMLGSQVSNMVTGGSIGQTRSWYNPGHSSVTESA